MIDSVRTRLADLVAAAVACARKTSTRPLAFSCWAQRASCFLGKVRFGPMRRSSSLLLLAGAAAGSLAISFAPGCGGTETTTGSTSTGAGGGAPVDLAHPPEPMEGAAAPDGSGSTV